MSTNDETKKDDEKTADPKTGIQTGTKQLCAWCSMGTHSKCARKDKPPGQCDCDC